MTLKTMSPIHIGNGNTYLQDVDFLCDNGHAYFFNDKSYSKLFEALDEEKQKVFFCGKLPLSKILKDANLDPKQLAYKEKELECHDHHVQLFEASRTLGKAYIPGSTLKGTLRTAIAKSYLLHLKKNYRDIYTLYKANYAAKKSNRSTESLIFGKIDQDCMKCMSLIDSELISEKKIQLYYGQTYHFQKHQKMAEQLYECIEQGTEIKLNLKIDQWPWNLNRNDMLDPKEVHIKKHFFDRVFNLDEDVIKDLNIINETRLKKELTYLEQQRYGPTRQFVNEALQRGYEIFNNSEGLLLRIGALKSFHDHCFHEVFDQHKFLKTKSFIVHHDRAEKLLGYVRINIDREKK